MEKIKQWRYPILLLLLTLLFYHSIILHYNLMLNSGDIVGVYALEKGFFAQYFHIYHSFPLWNPYLFSGTPFPGNPTTAMFYPPNWLFLIFNSDTTFGYIYALDVYLMALFTYLFAKEIIKDEFAAFVSGMIFGFSAITSVRLNPGHILILDGIVWFPLLLLCYEKLLQQKKIFFAIAAGIVVGLMLLSAFFQTIAYALFATCLYILFRIIFDKKLRNNLGEIYKNIILPVFLSFIIGMGIAAVQLLPTIEFTQYSLRTIGISFDFAASFSMHPFQIISFVLPYYFGSPDLFWGKGNFHETAAYCGVIPLLLIIFALQKRYNKYIPIFIILASIAVLYALGKYSPVFYLFRTYIPGFNSFRVSSRMLFVYVFSIALLAGFGLRNIYAKGADALNKKLLIKISIFPFVLGVLSFLFLLYLVFSSKNLNFFETIILRHRYAIGVNHRELLSYFQRDVAIFSVSFLFFSISTFLFIKKKISRFIYKTVIAVCIFCDLAFFGSQFVNLKSPQYIYNAPGIVNTIKKDHDTFRVFDLSQRINHILAKNNIQTTIGINSMQLKDYRDFFWLVGPHEDWPYESFFQFKHTITNPTILDLLNIKYVISDEKLDNKQLQQIDVSPTLNNIVVYKKNPNVPFYLYLNTNDLPRAYIVPQAVVASKNEQIKSIVSGKFNPQNTVLLEEKPTIPLNNKQNSSHVALTTYSPQKISLSVNLSDPGFLVLSEQWFPGWKAYDNGKEVPIYKADVILRAVALNKGNHIVEFIYDPLSFKLGLIITFVTLCICGIYTIVIWGKGKIR